MQKNVTFELLGKTILMKVFLYCFLVLVALCCKKSNVDVVGQDTVLDEYPDWYTLKAPVDRTISVWGQLRQNCTDF
jgi:hypothetical protein